MTTKQRKKIKALHTPGPWYLDENKRAIWGNPKREVKPSTNWMELIAQSMHFEQEPLIAVIRAADKQHGHRSGSPNKQESDANARLMAASPELLEACKIGLSFARYALKELDNLASKNAVAQIEAAISKATT